MSANPILPAYIDDRDSNVTYQDAGQWRQEGEAVIEWTTTSTETNGARARVRFTGSRIWVFGSIPSRGFGAEDPKSSYVLDGNLHAAEFVGRRQGTSQNDVLFYDTAVIPYREHVIEIQNLGRGFLTLDYFWVDQDGKPPESSAASSSSIPGSSASPPSTPTITATSASSTASSSLQPSTQASNSILLATMYVTETVKNPDPSSVGVRDTESSSSVPIGTIAGATVSVVGVFILLVVVLFLMRWRKRRRQAAERARPFDPTSTTVLPFTPQPAHSEPSSADWVEKSFGDLNQSADFVVGSSTRTHSMNDDVRPHMSTGESSHPAMSTHVDSTHSIASSVPIDPFQPPPEYVSEWVDEYTRRSRSM